MVGCLLSIINTTTIVVGGVGVAVYQVFVVDVGVISNRACTINTHWLLPPIIAGVTKSTMIENSNFK